MRLAVNPPEAEQIPTCPKTSGLQDSQDHWEQACHSNENDEKNNSKDSASTRPN
jgi:hypothetical protein